jgi:alpha-glucosidase
MAKNIFKSFSWLTTFLAMGVTQLFAFTPIGDVVSQQYGISQVDFTLSSGAIARIEILDSAIARVRVNPGGKLSNRISPAISETPVAPGAVKISETNGIIWVNAGKILLSISRAPFLVNAFFADGSPMLSDSTNSVIWDETTGKIIATKEARSNEHFFGLGMYGGPIDRTGRTFVMRNTDNSGYGEFTQPLYQSYPFYYGIHDGKAYGLFLDNPAFPFFDMNSSGDGKVLFGAESGELNYYIIAGPEPADVAGAYARLTGCNPLPPKWSLGYHHSHYGWNSEEQITNIAAQLRAQDFPCDTLWFDIDYMDEFHHFTWNPTNFPDVTGMHARLGQMGFHRVVINEPCLLQTDPLWGFMSASGYLVKGTNGQSLVDSIWFGDVSFIDYSNSEARDWYKEQLKTFLSLGISGLWLDLNEPANNFMPDAVYSFDGDSRSDLEARNIYALIEAKMAYAAETELRTNTRPWNFSRSGHSGIQRYSHTWSGDAPSTWDSLRVAVQMSISMGLSGQNQFGHDTGGFLGSPSGELFTRWLEFSCFTPLFRNHSMNTSDPREPWSFGEPYTAVIRQIIKQRYEFLPYIYTLFEEASRTGLPVLAPALFYAAGDQNAYAADSEYLFGPNLLVAPIFAEGSTNRSVYLPAGSDWVNFWTDELFPGGTNVTVAAPLGQIPLFVRKGGILVRGPVTDYVDAPVDPFLRLDIYPQGNTAFTLYEDDGKSFDYKNGAFARTEIRSEWEGEGGKVHLEKVSGDFELPPRPVIFTIHGVTDAPSGMKSGGVLLTSVSDEPALNSANQGWYYDSRAKTLRAKLQSIGEPLTLETIPENAFKVEPARLSALEGTNYTLTAVGPGLGNGSLQWSLIQNGATNSILGATNNALAITNIQGTNAGLYFFTLPTTNGTVNSEVSTVSVVMKGLSLKINSEKSAALNFQASSELAFSLQYKSKLSDPEWLTWTNVQSTNGLQLFEFIDPSAKQLPQRFYRVVAPASVIP